MNVDEYIKKIALEEGWKEDVMDRGLVINEKERRKIKNRNDYEAHRRERIRNKKVKNHTTVPCSLCGEKLKYSSLTKHRNNRKCKSRQAIIKEIKKESKKCS
jgi:hypothetical protein